MGIATAGRLLVALLSLCLSAPSIAGLRLGVAPYLSPRTLIDQYGPWLDYLQGELGQRIDFATAIDLPHFYLRCARQDFDLIITPPHLARLAQLESGYQPIAAIKSDFYLTVVVPRGDAARSMADLRGKRLNLPAEMSLPALQAEAFLARLDIDIRLDTRRVFHATENNALRASSRSKHDAAIASRTVLEAMPQEISGGLRVLGSAPSSISLVLMRSARLDANQQAALSTAMARFPYSQPGLAFFNRASSYLVPASAAELDRWDNRLPWLRQQLVAR
ncbi:phosphate/phosphite/phosphonate ABC transporter substrate-binding protein [Chitinimonas sp.]|uniref:phosphate/phosphite/phosphonate ABC transporter substrate-binding protein n=1 Tax=Chitinimonas sp. TaxID=1934313 RepID=UPI0035B2FB7E